MRYHGRRKRLGNIFYRRIREKTSIYTEKEKETLMLNFFVRVLQKVPPLIRSEEERNVLSERIEEAISYIPDEKGGKRDDYKRYLQLVNLTKTDLQKRYNLVSKGYYTRIWLPLGIAIGVPIGLLFKNLALGIGPGIAIGAGIAVILEGKAVKENRVI